MKEARDPKTKKTQQKAQPKKRKQEQQQQQQPTKLADLSSDNYDDSADDDFDVAAAEAQAEATRLYRARQQQARQAQASGPSSDESESSDDSDDSESSSSDGDVAAAMAVARGAASGDVVALTKGKTLKPAFPELPAAVKARVKALKRDKAEGKRGKANGKAKPGVDKDGRSRVIYIGRLPYGFFESQMRAFFEQFGEVKHLRLSRNKKTGRSKHFAFLEFDDADTALIAAESMDDYLLFRHRLQCHVVEPDNIHPDIWKGANQHYQRAPWRKVNRRRHNKPRDAERVKTITRRNLGREQSKREKIAALGIDYEFPGLQALVTAKLANDVAVAEAAVKDDSSSASRKRRSPAAKQRKSPSKQHKS